MLQAIFDALVVARFECRPGTFSRQPQ
jgi:hypothetical protein